jgi:bifunctional non-homologous end joining protein LigD
MGLEDIVFKQKERPPYRAGRCDHRIKMTNRKHPAMSRVHDQFA